MPSPLDRAAIILTHNRPDMLRDAVAAIWEQVDAVVVIDNASDPPIEPSHFNGLGDSEHPIALMRIPDQPPNLPKLWRIGMTTARRMRAAREIALPDFASAAAVKRGEHFHAAFLCDDTVAPAGWFDAVAAAMVETGAAAGCTNPFGEHHGYVLKTAPDGDLMHRMVGWAFVLDLNREIVPDPAMPWWWSDTDLDWQARAQGGMVMVGGGPALNVPNLRPNDHTMHYPGLAEQSGLDRATWAEKWGPNPW